MPLGPVNIMDSIESQRGNERRPCVSTTWPAWQKDESLEEYASRNHLESKVTLKTRSGQMLEFQLVPPGQFTVGLSPPPIPEYLSLTLVLALLTAAVAYVLVVVLRRNRRRLQYSLAQWTLFIFLCSLSLWSFLQYRELRTAWREYAAKSELCPTATALQKVEISYPFYLSVYQTTHEVFQSVVGHDPSFENMTGRDADQLCHSHYPATGVTYHEADEFVKKLQEVDPEYVVGLPTEAEWEYSCIVGSRGKSIVFPLPVDRLCPVEDTQGNALGIHGMLSFASEWTGTAFDAENRNSRIDQESPSTHGQPDQLSCELVVSVRGGCSYDADTFFPQYRRGARSTDIDPTIGFRPALYIKLPPCSGCGGPSVKGESK
jgi:hypothetical protein